MAGPNRVNLLLCPGWHRFQYTSVYPLQFSPVWIFFFASQPNMDIISVFLPFPNRTKPDDFVEGQLGCWWGQIHWLLFDLGPWFRFTSWNSFAFFCLAPSVWPLCFEPVNGFAFTRKKLVNIGEKRANDHFGTKGRLRWKMALFSFSLPISARATSKKMGGIFIGNLFQGVSFAGHCGFWQVP